VWIKTNPVSAAIAASSRFVEIDSFQQSRIRRDRRNRRAQGVWTDQFDNTSRSPDSITSNTSPGSAGFGKTTRRFWSAINFMVG
jgi:hypothetical protein